jgi:serine/threonine protein kinase/TolB-like protein/Tfp pilus assembly protein PilF
MTGTTVLHYRIGECLGVGGMGEVYLAEDTRLGRTVALKFLKNPDNADETQRTRLLREARAASSLRSSNIAAIYDVVEHSGTTFIVMEYVAGEAIGARIARGPLPVRDVVQIGMQAADALDEAHAHGVIHRDIKSANLIVDQRGRVKLLDFGLAKLVPGGESAGAMTQTAGLETVAGTVMGTFAYMSPEQVRGRAVDFRSDLFSLGVVLYEMLTARLPFEGGTITEVIDGVINHEPPALARFNYNIPAELERVVLKLLAKDADYRYQSARELYIDLSAIARGLDHPSHPHSHVQPTPSGFSPALTRLSQPYHQSGTSGQTGSSGGPSGLSGMLRQTPPPGSAEWDRGESARSLALARANSGPRGVVVPQVLDAEGMPRDRAVAVMTFANITRDANDEWIGSGIAETVTADLKNVRGINVIGRTQVFDALKHLSTADLQRVNDQVIDIGRRLGATWVVGGAYQRLGPSIRITAEFVDVRNGRLLKTVKIDGKVDDLFSLQDKIVYELSQGLNVSLRPSEIQAIARDETGSIEAYEAFSRGTMNLRLGTPESMDRAIEQFEQALGIDPHYASAWALLGVTCSLKGQFLTLPDLTRRAVELLEHALALDPNHPAAHAGLGSAYLSSGRVEDAIRVLKRGTELDPTSALAHGTLARAYWIGQGAIEDALQALARAVALNPESGYAFLQLSLLHALRGDYGQAEAAGRQAVALQEKFMSGTEGLQVVGGHVRVGYALYRQGKYDDAIAEFERELAFVGSHDHALRERVTIEVQQKLSAAWWRKGDREKADQFFKGAMEGFNARVARGADDPFTKYYIASLHALRDDVGTAVKLLGESMQALPALNRRRAVLDPDFDPIRGLREFIALMGNQWKSGQKVEV